MKPSSQKAEIFFANVVAHRLELSLDDALSKSTEFEEVGEMLRQMFYL